MRNIILVAAVVASGSANAADNPMWRSGLIWSCGFASVIACERSLDCTTKSVAGTIDLDYRENRVVDPMGAIRPIKRHYTQSVTGSPISIEVKIELTNNEVLWLSPVDAAGTFSDNWVGAMLSPSAGVVVQELRPLSCKPLGRQ